MRVWAMLIDLSNQNEGDGRGFRPVEARPQHACNWDAYFKRKQRFRWIRRALRIVMNRKIS